ncbi:hypothetical protein F4780DRAFT_629144 [Xylariomycetidae sp. FL0641]|nr:hypothetical protein F4780DRAFT_629144 [Xylariomycetidae sp. FL0641]
MADLPRRGRNRPDSRQMWDESDHRSRRGPAARDRRDDRDRDRDRYREDTTRDRERRYRSRSRSPRRDRRDRNRSRSRDRREKDRDREYDRGRPRDYGRPRGRDEERYPDRPRDARRDEDRDRRPRRRDDDIRTGEDDVSKATRHSNPRRSASPTRSPGVSERSTHNSPLPTRLKSRDRGAEASRAGKHALDGRGRDHDSRDTPEHERRHGGGSSRMVLESTETPEVDAMDEDDDLEVDEDMSAMQAMMGFGGFGTTKGTHVIGNNAGAVRKEKKTEYRQYMNRVGGFNRPLSPG